MELISPQSPFAALFSSRSILTEKSTFLTGQALTIPRIRTCPEAKNLRSFDFRAQSSGTLQGMAKAVLETTFTEKQENHSKDNDLAFVAGATGRVGSRTVRELLKLGFRVRAGVRSKQKAETLVQSVQQLKIDGVAASTSGNSKPIVEKLEIVECDLENRDEIGSAISSASVVICCIGASEKEVFDVTGPYRIDYQATKHLIDAATVAKVNHFILLTSLGTSKIGFPASILNLFWGVLIWKRKAEKALIASGLPFTIVRPGGMERPTDAYKETHNIVLADEDTYFGGQVSNLQVAELMAFMAENRGFSSNKVVEVIAETTAPLLPMEELLAKIPSKGGPVFKKVQAEPEIKPTSADGIPSEPSSTSVEKEPVQAKVQKTRPLSPYIVYEDLKPPTSPTPTPSSASIGLKEEPLKFPPSGSLLQYEVGESKSKTTHIVETEVAQVPSQKSGSLSPYTILKMVARRNAMSQDQSAANER